MKKRSMLLLSLLLVCTVSVMAQDSFPDPLPDPNGVPIVESLVALLGLGGAYAVKLWRGKKKRDEE